MHAEYRIMVQYPDQDAFQLLLTNVREDAAAAAGTARSVFPSATVWTESRPVGEWVRRGP